MGYYQAHCDIALNIYVPPLYGNSVKATLIDVVKITVTSDECT